MEGLIIYFLPTILALGAVTSYEDLKEGKIRNKYLAAAAIVGLITHAILLLSGIEGIRYLVVQMVGTIAAFFTALFIWYIKWWSAGDAKLFTTYFFLLPISVFKNASLSFAVIALLVNTVLPVWMFLLIRASVFQRKSMLRILRRAFNYKEIARSVLLVLSTSWLIYAAFQRLGIVPNPLASIAIFFIIGAVMQKYLKDWDFAVYLAVLLSRAVLDEQLFSSGAIVSTILLLLGYYFARYFIVGLMQADSAQKAKTNKKAGNILYFNRQDDNLAFAPMLFLGALMTILLGQSIETAIINMFR